MNKVNESLNNWGSQLVNKIEEDYKLKKNSFEKLEFLILLFLDYRINHSHGEYDILTIIDEKTEFKRINIMPNVSYGITNKFLVKCNFLYLCPFYINTFSEGRFTKNDSIWENIENKKKAGFEQEIFAKIGIKPNARIMSGIDQALKTRIEMQVAGIALEFERVSRLENRTLSDNLVSKQLEEINAVTNRVLQGVKAGERWESISMAILGRKDPKTSSQVVKAAAREGNQQAAKMLNRARFIARNAVSTAQGEYDKQIQLKTGIRLYRWSTSDDERVRPTHEKLDGKVFAWEPGTTAPKDITIDGKTYAEGDIIPTASDPNYNGGAPTIPGQPYNCRCVALAVIEGIDY